jgi:predicted ATPase/class 3 adenylate cyclase
MAELPSGTVTFLLTDVEGSTALWEEAPEAMPAALARHDALFEAAVAEHRGVHIRPRGEGDSRFAVFDSAPDAIAAAIGIQRALAAEPWPTPRPIKVRIGIHTGEAELRDGDYYGSAVNRCARLRNLGHGGQVLLSEATTVLTREQLPRGATLLGLGQHRLKGLTQPEHVFQVAVPDLPSDFPSLVSLDARPNNLPTHPTALLGRERERAEIRALFQGDTQLVTLTGPGGTGKTRLSLQVAADLLDDFEHGVFVVELASIVDPVLVSSIIAQVLGLRDVGGRPVLDRLKEYLRTRTVLLVLDNFEQILAAAPVVADLLASSSHLRMLVTSREPLRLRGEHEYAVPPLTLPDGRHPPTPEVLREYAAIALFLERAMAIRPDFAVTSDNAPAIIEICTRLDGLPLAIELAAARVRLLTPQAMAGRLQHRLPLLIGGARDLPTRQQTLRGTIAWSYDLLHEPERRLFRRLSGFMGGWTLEAAETVCGSDGDVGIDILDGLESLITKSLVRRDDGADGEPRFGMLETIREYGLEQLAQAGELDELRRWHAEYFLDLTEQAVPRLRGAEQRAWLDRLEAEHDNLRAALDWSVTADRQMNVALRLSGALAWFWAARGHISEGRRWLGRTLTAPSAQPTPRLEALYGAGWLAHICYDSTAARQYLHTALALAREHDDRWSTAWTLHLLGRVAYYSSDARTARERGEQSLEVAREVGDEWLIAWALHLLGLAAHISDDYTTARGYYEAVLAIRRRLGYQEGTGMCAFLLGLVAYRQADYAAARTLTREALLIFRDLGAKWTIQNTLASSAALAALTQPELAVRLAGATQALGESVAVPPIPLVLGILKPALERTRAELGETRYSAAWAEGRAMTLEQAVAYALEE